MKYNNQKKGGNPRMFLAAERTPQKRAERKNGRKERYRQDSVDRSDFF